MKTPRPTTQELCERLELGALITPAELKAVSRHIVLRPDGTVDVEASRRALADAHSRGRFRVKLVSVALGLSALGVSMAVATPVVCLALTGAAAVATYGLLGVNDRMSAHDRLALDAFASMHKRRRPTRFATPTQRFA